MSYPRLSPWSRALVTGLVVLLALSACTAGTPAAPSPASGTPTGAEPSTVIVTYVQEPDNLNPLYTATYYGIISRDLFLRGLWAFDDQNQPVMQAAAELPTEENGGVGDGGRTLTIRLNPDAVWSDGTPLTAADFVFTYEMYVAEQNIVVSAYPYADYVESVEAADDHTLVIHFSEPFAAWQTTIFASEVLPRHILQPVFEADGTLDNAAWNRAPTVGFGPYVFKEWESGSHLIFERNPNWHGAPPKIDRVFIRLVPFDAAQEAAIKAGETDIGIFLDYSQVEGIEQSGMAQVVSVLAGSVEGWFLNVDPNTAHPALLDVRVRRALALATDRERITRDLLLGRTQPPATFWDTTPPFGNPDMAPYPYDPAEAGALLDEAGWTDSNGDGTRDKDGVELVLRYVTNDRQLRHDVQAVVQQMWAEVGIGAELITYSSDVFWNSYGDGGPQAVGDYDVAQYSSAGLFPDPDASFNWLCSEIPSADYPEGGNWQGYCNEAFDALLIQQATTANRDERIQLYYRIAQMMHDEVIWIGLWRDPDLWSVSTRLRNVRISGASPFWNISEWEIAP